MPADLAVPRHLARVLRPELPGLADEIIREIRVRIPEYARPMDGPYGRALRTGVRLALSTFVDLVADPSGPREQRDVVCRRLGRFEALEGRTLDSLQEAYRVGAQVAWRRLMRVGQRGELSSAVMSGLADAMLGYVDEMAALSVSGYRAARAESAAAVQEWRRRLLGLILEPDQAPARAVTDLAALAGWAVPAEVTLVAIEPGPPAITLPQGTDLLADLAGGEPCLLVPGGLDPGRRQQLRATLGGRRSAAGLCVPLGAAADSLRWARRALALGSAGVITGDAMLSCEDHLVPLLLLTDPALVDQLARRQLAALAGMTSGRRRRLTQTLSAWLEARGSAAEVAARLQIHPQTVRYRLRQLEQAFGGALTDPDQRFAAELALRARTLRERCPP
ncbi:MAG TPA: helix-turn-helix domain-containing protein [Streptosporangiaceae bacterium]|jgi:hypothetical protein